MTHAVYEEHAEQLPDLEAMFLKLHQLGHFIAAEASLLEMVQHIAIIEQLVCAWEILKGLFRLPGFNDDVIASHIQVLLMFLLLPS